MVQAVNRRVVATIQLNNIMDNIKQIKLNCLNSAQQLFAVVKADAYGHGAVSVAKHIENEVDGFCVAMVDEALELRQEGIIKPILVMGLTTVDMVEICAQQDISVTFSDVSFVESISQMTLSHPLKVHLAIDTGMNRIGVKNVSEIVEIENRIKTTENIILEGVFTHFATADGEDDNKVVKQYELFEMLLSHLTQRPKYVHLSNSAMTLWRSQFPSDIARVGIAMYGLNPSDFVLDLPIELKPALKLEAEIAFIHLLKKGESVSYGAKYIAKQDEWVATLPIGYADGWRREYASCGVYLNGQKCPVLGVICMDQLMIKVPEGTQVGERVELIGEYQSASDVALSVSTIGYEVLCGLSNRIQRQYRV